MGTALSHIKKNMILGGRKAKRPSQKLAFSIITAALAKTTWRVSAEMEYRVNEIVPAGGTDLTGNRVPTLDIAIKITKSPGRKEEKYAFWINGGYHDTDDRANLDLVQQLVLKHKANGSWKIIVFEYWKMPYLFSVDKEGTIESTDLVLKATAEVRQALIGIFKI